MKGYTVRFYQGRAGADGDGEKVSEILQSIIERQNNDEEIPRMAEGGMQYEIRNLRSFNRSASFRGVLAVLRDDAPHIRAANGDERPIELADDEHVIEKNHFLFFRRNELLVWQVNGRASHISRFERFLTRLKNTTVSFEDVLNQSALERLRQGIVKRFELRVARPRNPDGINPNNWEDGVFDLMNGIEGTTLHIEIATRRRNLGLSNNVKGIIHRLLNRAETRSLKVKLDGDTDPIDLFADCLRERIEVRMDGLYPAPDSIFNQLAQAKDRQQGALDDYFGVGDRVLE